ncbi:CBS domain-containing protein [Halobacteriaceae archaeon GCM10025711]
MKARDLMTTDVETVSPDDEVSDVLTRMGKADFNGYPVVDDDGVVVGIVTQSDLVDIFQPSGRTLWIPIGFPPFLESLEYGIDLSWGELDAELDLLKHAGRPVRELMTEDVVTVDADADVETVLAILAADDPNINRVPVVEDGRLVGIITRQDALTALLAERRE